MPIHHLTTVDAFVAYDFDDAPFNGGGTRYAPDVTEHEAALLARAMTYKFGVIDLQAGGAKGAVRGTPEQKAERMKLYCEEVRPLVESRKFGTGPDLGTSEADFATLRDPNRSPSVMAAEVNGVGMEDLITGFGVIVAAETAMSSVEHATLAIEGFGKVGGGVGREAVRRGARVVAISTIDGCVHNAAGIDVELLTALRRQYGDRAIRHVGGEFRDDPTALFDIDADVLVPGARTGVITPDVAARVRVRWIVPAANAPYTAGALDVLRNRRIRYLADFVCNSGAMLGYTASASTPAELFPHVERRIAAIQGEAGAYPQGPFEGACLMAERFIESWRGPDGLPTGPPLA